jgi:hypothetical protein
MVAVAMYFGEMSEWKNDLPTVLALSGWFVACFIAVVAYYSLRPSRPELAVYEDGLCYRGERVRYAELLSIRIGSSNTSPEDFDDFDPLEVIPKIGALLRIVHQFRRVRAERRCASAKASLKLAFRDGTEMTMSEVLIRYEKEDLIRFFDVIAAKHPELVSRL